MYKRHSNWDEDKLDIHGTGSTGSSGGYAGHGHHEHGGNALDYHANKDYSSKDSEGGNDTYMSMKRHDEIKKKDNEDKEKTIVDAVNQEEKYSKDKNKEESKEERFHTATRNTGDNSNSGDKGSDNETIKHKNNKSIEDAIKEAIKEEKETVHID